MIRNWGDSGRDYIPFHSLITSIRMASCNGLKLSKKILLGVFLFVGLTIYYVSMPNQVQGTLENQVEVNIFPPLEAMNNSTTQLVKMLEQGKVYSLLDANDNAEVRWFKMSFNLSTLVFPFQGERAPPVLYIRATACFNLSNITYTFRRYYLSDGKDFHDGFGAQEDFLDSEKLLLEFIGFDAGRNELDYRLSFGFHRDLSVVDANLKLSLEILVDYLSLKLGVMDANECNTQRFLGKLSHSFLDVSPFLDSRLHLDNTWKAAPDVIVLNTFRNWFIHDGGPSLTLQFEYNYNGQSALKCSSKEFSFSSKRQGTSSFGMLLIGDSQPHNECTQLQGSLGRNGGSITNKYGKIINMAVKCAPMRAGGITANTFWMRWLKDQLDAFLVPKPRNNEIDKMLVLNFAGLWEAQRGKINIDNGTSFELRLASMINKVIDAVELYEKNSNAHVEIYYMTTTMIQPHNHFSIISMETDYHPMSELRNIWFNQLVRKIFHQNARINSKVILVDTWLPSRANEDDMSSTGDPLHYNGKGSRKVVNFLLCHIFKRK